MGEGGPGLTQLLRSDGVVHTQAGCSNVMFRHDLQCSAVIRNVPP